MIIDTPQSRDVPGLKALWQQSFGDTAAFIDRFFETGFSKERCRCLYENGSLAAALYWFDCQWRGQKVAYLYAIATDEKHRNKGFCKALMESTHMLLETGGYAGAILVPAEEPLFRMYAKLGYRGICPMQVQTVAAGDVPVAIQPIDHQTYGKRRAGFLPEGGVVQDEAALAYFATYGEFYQAEGALFCCSRDGDTVYFQEYLGCDRVPGVLAALRAQTGKLRQPGGNVPYAMYKPFTQDAAFPAYFGIPLD